MHRTHQLVLHYHFLDKKVKGRKKNGRAFFLKWIYIILTCRISEIFSAFVLRKPKGRGASRTLLKLLSDLTWIWSESSFLHYALKGAQVPWEKPRCQTMTFLILSENFWQSEKGMGKKLLTFYFSQVGAFTCLLKEKVPSKQILIHHVQKRDSLLGMY